MEDNEQDDSKEQSPEQEQTDLLKNMKAEFDRKQDNVSEQISLMQQTQNALLQSVDEAKKKQRESAASDSIDELMYTDPQAAIEQIEARMEAKMEKKLEQKINANQQQSSVISELVGSFPELADGSHDLTKASVAIYEKMDASIRKSPEAYKSAVYQAALEGGYKPLKKRERKQNDDFTFTGSGGGGGNRPPRDNDKVADSVLRAAEAFGLDTSSKEVKARLKKHSGRNYFKYK